MIWVLAAIISSFIMCAYIEFNHHHKIPGPALVLIRSGIITLLSAPVALVYGNFNQSIVLYSIGIGICVTISDILLYNATAIHGGRLSSLFMALKIAILFVAWLVLDPNYTLNLLNHPLQFTGIIIALGIMFTALQLMRKNDASFQALLAVIPVAILLSVADLQAKYNLQQFSTLIDWFTFFTIVNGIGTLGVLALSVYRKTFKDWVCNSVYWGKGIIFTSIFIPMLVTFLISLQYSPNPAYASAICLLTTVWLTFYDHLILKKETGSLIASALLLLGAVILVLLAE